MEFLREGVVGEVGRNLEQHAYYHKVIGRVVSILGIYSLT